MSFTILYQIRLRNFYSIVRDINLISNKYMLFFICQGDGSCGGKKCHRNAECAEIDGVKQCQCKDGFVGSGLICIGTSCFNITDIS